MVTGGEGGSKGSSKKTLVAWYRSISQDARHFYGAENSGTRTDDDDDDIKDDLQSGWHYWATRLASCSFASSLAPLARPLAPHSVRCYRAPLYSLVRLLADNGSI